MPSQSGSEYARRDRLLCWLCNQLLRLASKRYRDMIGGAILYGLRAAAQDVSVTSTARERLVFDYIKGEVRRERY